ncbi:MAG: DegT/DnrJ/EryC1/StrS family aminotransferase [Planctomycetes bacterium]|nr:DegT/DnrJ/EryC1/StrS family aminotransferase [Planctomycetota bacterium]
MPGIIKYIDLPRQYAALRKDIFAEFEAIFGSGHFVLGNSVKDFETQFAEYLSVHHCITVHSGTAALVLALRALGIGRGDEVIVPANSFISTAGAVYEVGARCVFADVGDDMNLDPEEIVRLVGAETKAIIPVHLTGKPAQMERITSLAREYNLYMIEDNAQAVGAMIGDQKVGAIGDFGCFSFHPLKTLNAAGDGGAIVTNSNEWADKLRSLRNHGLVDRDKCSFWGTNSRLDELQAAVLKVNLRYLDEWTEVRIRHARRYTAGLSDIVQTPEVVANLRCVYHTYIIQADQRDELKDFLARAQIETKIHYPTPIHRQVTAGNQSALPRCERQAQRILSLPIHQYLSTEEVDYVIEKIRNFYQ